MAKAQKGETEKKDPEGRNPAGADGANSTESGGAEGLPPIIPEEPPEPVRSPSRFFAVLASIFYLGLLGLCVTLMAAMFLLLDFLDILQFRYAVPESLRGKWPLSSYYEFVRLHQLPDEEQLREKVKEERERYNSLVSQGDSNLKKRAEELEIAYRDLVKSQQDVFKKQQEELARSREELAKERTEVEKAKKDLEGRRETIDILSQQIASEAMNLESSLIKFTEDENRLKPMQEMAASMDPRAMATMLDEVSDSKLVYDLLKGIPPERSAMILSYMDPERAGKIIKMTTIPVSLPSPGSRTFIPKSLENLIASAQANLK